MAIHNRLTEKDESMTALLLQQDQRHDFGRRLHSNTSSQVALIGSNLCPIESLDYENIENDFFNHDWRSWGKTEMYQYIFMKWAMCFIIGLVVGLLGFLINLAIENIAGVKFVITSDMMLARKFIVAFFVFATSNICLSLLAVVFTAFFAPEVAGSGIPEVKAYLNGVDAPAIFSLKTLVVKIVGIILVASSSLNIGKAGPMVHISACIAALLSQGGSMKYGLTWKGFRDFKNDRDQRDFVTCGCAAGIAAAFRAPVGGVLFALEEMASWWRGALLWRSFFTTTVVAIVLRALIDTCLRGECGLFGKGGLIMYNVTAADIAYHITDVPPVLLLAVIGGILGSIYNFVLDRILQIYKLINEKGIAYKIILAGSLSIFTSCLLFGLPWTSSCRPCPSDASEPCPSIGRSGNYKKFQCSPGLFVPVIVTGAAYGRLVGICVGSNSTLNHGLFAVLGSASLLGGSMRTTVSLCVIVLELTDNLLLLPLVMLVLLISKTVADVFDRSIYDIIMTSKGLPYLQAHAEPYMRQLTVGDVITGPLHVFNGIEKVGNIVHVLKTTGHNGFPVVDCPSTSSPPVLSGLILRSHLITVLKRKQFTKMPIPVGSNAFSQFSADEFGKQGFGHVDRIEDIELSEEEMEMFIDVHPFINTSPYTVVETMSLAKALVLFRQVALRHLLVIPKVPGRDPVVGILTRHDFMPEHVLTWHPGLKRGNWRRLRVQLPQFFWL